jgi:hypothetical protein
MNKLLFSFSFFFLLFFLFACPEDNEKHLIFDCNNLMYRNKKWPAVVTWINFILFPCECHDIAVDASETNLCTSLPVFLFYFIIIIIILSKQYKGEG